MLHIRATIKTQDVCFLSDHQLVTLAVHGAPTAAPHAMHDAEVQRIEFDLERGTYNAILAGRVINVLERCYHRRVHPAALTRSAATGYCSPARRALQPLLQDRARQNVARALAGGVPDLTPFCRGPSPRLAHAAVPRLRWKS